MDMNAAPEFLRSQASMHSPLLEPDRLKRPRCHLGDQGQDVRTTKGPKPVLGARSTVRITGIERSWRRGVEEDQARVQICLKECIEVHVCGEVAQGVHKSRGPGGGRPVQRWAAHCP